MKNPKFGGIQYENRHPGMACDLPGCTFKDYTQWPEFYSAGQDILAYIKCVAEKYHIDRYLKLQNEDLTAGTVYANKCGFLVVILSLHNFNGRQMHTANLDEPYDIEDKEVIVNGSDSSALQVEPAHRAACRVPVLTDGIETIDGKVRKVDTIVTDTGFDSYLPRFPITGTGGMPSFFLSLGPDSTPPTGSAIVAIESQCQYMIDVITKCQHEGYKTIQVE
ncbi:flavin-binding monooxygenase [Grosmannia clavigera kw1407]|uniref:Flavin-binding monooxygenase n=1 Tax=Grosmannia clavigera (strain kw1407 / UAMH 11150) TaxID=655863 RepID=F0XDK6_GROCL|nr:flavin-binding monooxygenase [Grosmannia clavigera kw1407]EFX04597.1 flavin-binding monooxygenase [Grosmannia clavigera kw1407]